MTQAYAVPPQGCAKEKNGKSFDYSCMVVSYIPAAAAKTKRFSELELRMFSTGDGLG
jgi:hypothetical protein